MSASTSTTSKVIETFKPCTTTYEPCTLGESLESFRASGDTPRSFPLGNTIPGEGGFVGTVRLKFNALFTPEGSTDSFQAQLYLESSVVGDLPDDHPALIDAHLCIDKDHPDVLHSIIDVTKSSDKANNRSDRFLNSELKVYDTRNTLTDESTGVSVVVAQVFAVEWEKVEYRADICEVNTSDGSSEFNTSDGGRDIKIPSSDTIYRGRMW